MENQEFNIRYLATKVYPQKCSFPSLSQARDRVKELETQAGKTGILYIESVCLKTGNVSFVE